MERQLSRYLRAVAEVGVKGWSTGPLLSRLSELMSTMWTKGAARALSPVEMLKQIRIGNPMFRGYEQHDSHELLRSLLDLLHEEVKEKDADGNVSSFIEDLFGGELTSECRCLKCGHVSKTKENFTDLSLPVPDKTQRLKLRQSGDVMAEDEAVPEATGGGWMSWFRCGRSPAGGALGTLNVDTCVRAFCAPEILSGDERITCEKCKKLNDVEKTIQISKLPEILCLHIKRFRYTSRGISAKVHDQVRFPCEGLDMAAWCTPETLQSVESTKFDLFGVVAHSGDCDGGHYIAQGLNYSDHNWYQFDDATTNRVDENHVAKAEAYLLFYGRRCSDREKEREGLLKLMEHSPKGEEEQTYLLSRDWYSRWRCMDHVGKIRHEQYICAHGRLNIRNLLTMNQLFVTVPQCVWEPLQKKYQGGPALPTGCSVGPCPACEEELQRDEERRRAEKRAIAEADTTTINNEYGYWYIIDAGWLRRWRQYTAEGATAPPPGPVSNEVLLGPDGTPRKGLRKVDHYRGVNEQVWNIFQDYHGGGPEIQRREINLYAPDVEPETTSSLTTGQMK